MAQTTTQPTTTEKATQPNWQPHAALSAWLLPGLGHIVLGQRRRGIILGVTILTLWGVGLLIGGVSAIDHKQHQFWFFGQVMIGPSLAVDTVNQRIKPPPSVYGPEASPNYEPSYGKVNEQGLLYTALAGLLNLLAIMDVVYCDPAYRRHLDQQPTKAKPAPPAKEAAT